MDVLLESAPRQRSSSASLPVWEEGLRAESAKPEGHPDSEDEIDQLADEVPSTSKPTVNGITGVGSTGGATGLGNDTPDGRSASVDRGTAPGAPQKQLVRCGRCEKSNTECIAGPRVSCARCRAMHQSCSLVNKTETADADRNVEDEMLKMVGHTEKPSNHSRKSRMSGGSYQKHGRHSVSPSRALPKPAIEIDRSQREAASNRSKTRINANDLPTKQSSGTGIGTGTIPSPLTSTPSRSVSVTSSRSDAVGGGTAALGPVPKKAPVSSDELLLPVPNWETSVTPGQLSTTNGSHAEGLIASTSGDRGSTTGRKQSKATGAGSGRGVKRRRGVSQEGHHGQRKLVPSWGLVEELEADISTTKGERYLLRALRKSNQAAKLYSEAVEELTQFIEARAIREGES